MKVTRRGMLGLGGGGFAALTLPPAVLRAADIVEIEMTGRGNGARVWFDPIGIRIEPGQTIRWVNRDVGNTHTATAYHPANFNRPRRIPEAASPWNSGFLLPGKAFSVKLTRPGVYDYFCLPHEAAGMVGRIIVGEPGAFDWSGQGAAATGLPKPALEAFPRVGEIMDKGVVRRR